MIWSILKPKENIDIFCEAGVRLNSKDLNKTIDELFKTTTEVINGGKEEIDSMVLELREEYNRKLAEFSNLQKKLHATIEEVDVLSIEEKRSRKRLMEVSNDFERFVEFDIKEAYEYTHALRLKLDMKSQEEKFYISKRKDLELSLKKMLKNIEKGEKTIEKLGKISEYIEGSKKGIDDTLENLNKMQSFGIKIIETQEEERKRISRDIHDGPAQDMANIMIRAEYCEKIIDRDFLRAREEIKDLKRDVRNTLDNIRRIIYDLRPMSLDDLGLIPTLEQYIADFKSKNELGIDFKVEGDFDNLNTGIETVIYRIIQESFNNIRKHSKAKNVYLDFKIAKGKEKKIVIKIEDDGVGFSDKEYREKLQSKNCGFGIIGMRERVETIEGSFTIDARESIGTTIMISIPIIAEGRVN